MILLLGIIFFDILGKIIFLENLVGLGLLSLFLLLFLFGIILIIMF
jgi:hypothetical protein